MKREKVRKDGWFDTGLDNKNMLGGIMNIGECCNREVVMMNGDESVKFAAELMR